MAMLSAMTARRGANDASSQSTLRLVGRNIARARKAAEITQSALGRAIGLSQAMISDYENGIIDPGLTVMSRIAYELGVSAQDLARPALGDLPVRSRSASTIAQLHAELADIVEQLRLEDTSGEEPGDGV